MEEQTKMAMKLSLEEREKYNKPDKQMRTNAKPVGLKNVGNSRNFPLIIVFDIR